jgi:hypothetical protein
VTRLTEKSKNRADCEKSITEAKVLTGLWCRLRRRRRGKRRKRRKRRKNKKK